MLLILHNKHTRGTKILIKAFWYSSIPYIDILVPIYRDSNYSHCLLFQKVSKTLTICTFIIVQILCNLWGGWEGVGQKITEDYGGGVRKVLKKDYLIFECSLSFKKICIKTLVFRLNLNYSISVSSRKRVTGSWNSVPSFLFFCVAYCAGTINNFKLCFG